MKKPKRANDSCADTKKIEIMEEQFVYILKSSLVLIILTVPFMLLLRNETCHGLKRALLLFTALFSLILPSLFLGVTIDEPAAYLSVNIDYYVKDGRVWDDELYSLSAVPEKSLWEKISELTPSDWATYIYFFVAFVMLLRLLLVYCLSISMMLRLAHKAHSYWKLRGMRLIVHKEEGYMPFSWFGWVFVSRDDFADGAREILCHEKMHVKHLHSLDVLIADIVIVLQWFNPFAWKLKGLLQELHEYEADAMVLSSGVNIVKYKHKIIKEAVGKELYAVVCGFSNYTIKKRIAMMQKKNNGLWQYAKALYILPLAFLTACSFSSNDKASAAASDSVYVNVDTYPQFIGGLDALQNYLISNIKYPEASLKNKEEGKVLVEFVVDADGSIGDVAVAQSSGYALLDAEAVRVVSSMSKWTPGVYKGVNVNTKFNQPVVFKLPVSTTEEVDVQPEYPGGMDALLKFISDNLNYPSDCKKAKIEGRAIVEFIVAADGKVCNAAIMQSANNASLDAEALRVVGLLPQWKPGEKDGKAVDVRFYLPVAFRLN